MGLLGWWQLENDRDNSGNGKHITTLSGVTLTDGKIGKCYEFTSGSRMIASGITVGHSCTITAWGYSTSWASSTMLFSLDSASFSGPDLYFTGGVICWNTGDGNSNPFKNNGANVTQPSLNTWHHYAVVVDAEKNKAYLYLNGEYYGEANYKSPYQSNRNFVIGNYSVNTSYAWRGRIDDVRLYDYCLSPKEIKELAKAKILHYKFDDFQEPTQNILGTITPSYSKWGTNEGTSTYFTAPNGNQGVRLEITSFTDGGVNWYNTGGQRNAEPSTQYTVSATIKYEGGTPHPNLLYLRQYRSDGTQISEAGQFSTSYIEDLGNGWYRAYRTFTTHAECAKFLIQGYEYKKIKIWIYDIQCEKKAYHTPYVANDRAGVVYDCSGYDYHAKLSLEETPEWVEDPEMGGSYRFNGSQSIKLNDSLPSPPDQVTVSAWVKTDDASAYQHVFSKGVNTISCAIYQSKMYCKFNIGGVNRNPKGNTILQSNRWYHLVWLYDGTNIKFYIDGNLDMVSPTYTGQIKEDDETTIIGAEFSTYPMNMMKGLISDVKVYATALSDGDIKELYQTRASLDSHGNLYASKVMDLDSKILSNGGHVWDFRYGLTSISGLKPLGEE